VQVDGVGDVTTVSESVTAANPVTETASELVVAFARLICQLDYTVTELPRCWGQVYLVVVVNLLQIVWNFVG
jgi:hypothetical protein